MPNALEAPHHRKSFLVAGGTELTFLKAFAAQGFVARSSSGASERKKQAHVGRIWLVARASAARVLADTLGWFQSLRV